MVFKKIGIIGAGTMGSGIATALAQVGVESILTDSTHDQAAAGHARVRAFFEKAASKGKISEQAAQEAISHSTVADGLDQLAGCDLVIEAIFEEFSVKADLLKRLDKVIGADVVVATNTSALTVSGLADHISQPSRFLGLHFFNPAAVNPVVEVVRGQKTDAALYDKALAFVRSIGKTAIACKDSYGFAINRFFVPYGNEAVRLLDEGIGTVPQIDRVAKDVLAVAAGPFQVMNLVKPKIMFHAQQNLAPHGQWYQLADTLKARGDSDYTFDLEGDDRAGSDPDGDKKIGDRILAAVFFPILQEIDESVATPADIDEGALQALKFGKAPCQLMDEMGADKVRGLVTEMIAGLDHTPPAALAKIGGLRG